MRLIEWLKGEGTGRGFLRDLIFVVLVVGAISAISQITLGVWTPMVAVESGSMDPNMKIGDIVLIQGVSKTNVITWENGETTGHDTFNNPGDVILYRPYGKEKLTLIDQAFHLFLRKPYPPEKATPIIHRALCHVEEGELMWEGGPPAPFSGYITKGDNNTEIDQRAGEILGVVNQKYFHDQQMKGEMISIGKDAYLDKQTGLAFIDMDNETYAVWGINYMMPVRDEWVIGVARLRIPLIGYVRLLPSIVGDEIRDLLS